MIFIEVHVCSSQIVIFIIFKFYFYNVSHETLWDTFIEIPVCMPVSDNLNPNEAPTVRGHFRYLPGGVVSKVHGSVSQSFISL